MNFFPPNEDVVVPSNLINNVARIVFQTTPITADQHRDLENLLTLIQQAAVIFEEADQQTFRQCVGNSTGD